MQEYLEESRKLPKPQQVSSLINLLAGGGAVSAFTAAAAGAPLAAGTAPNGGAPLMSQQSPRGMDPKFPLHVQIHNPTSARAALIALTGRVLIAFVVVSALSLKT